MPAAKEPVFTLATAEDLRNFGRCLAAFLVAGDVVSLIGPLGAGKTTLTQGIGAGLGVQGRVTSPTFIVARAHPGTDGGPALIHVDAYRLGDLADLETLDLDAQIPAAVTVMEWGEEAARQLSTEVLEIEIDREDGADLSADRFARSLDNLGDGVRRVSLRPVGERWVAALSQVTIGLRDAGFRAEAAS